MIQIIKKMFKKKVAIFTMIFLSAIFIQATSVSAKGQTISPVCSQPLNENIFINSPFYEVLNYPYIEFYEELVNYYETNLINYYDTYIILAGASGSNYYEPQLYYFNKVDVNNDFEFTIDNRYGNANMLIKLDLGKYSNRIFYESGVFYDKEHKNNIISSQNYIPIAKLSSHIYLFETNLEKNLKVSTTSYCKTILFKSELFNYGDVLVNFPIKSKENILTFDLDGHIYKDGIYKGLNFYFKKPDDGELIFKIELIENGSDKPSFDFVSAFDLSFLNLADTLERIKQCEYNPDGFGGCFTGSGGSFGGGGGGGRFGDDDDYCGFSSFPLNINTIMTSDYGIFTILPCQLHKQKTPDYFKTEQIKITTNSEVYLTYKDLEEEFLTNPPDWFDWNDLPSNSIKKPSDIFKIVNQYINDNKIMINEVSKISNTIFNGFNKEIRAFIIASYSLLVLSGIAILVRK